MPTDDAPQAPQDHVEAPIVAEADKSVDGPADGPFDPNFMDPAEVVRDRERRAKNSRRSIQYTCSSCGREVGRGNLKTKRVQFKEMGVGGQTVLTRTVAWLCIIPADDGGPSCLEADPDWSRKAFVDSPGMKDVLSVE